MLYGSFTGALQIQAGLCNEGRDLCSGQSRGGTIQQMAVQKKKGEANELVQRAASGEEFIPHLFRTEQSLAMMAMNKWMDGRDGRRAGGASTGQTMSSQAGALSQSQEHFCLRGF